MVCNRPGARLAVRERLDWALVSIRDASANVPDWSHHTGPRLSLAFDDLTRLSPSALAAGYLPPRLEHALTIVAFAQKLPPDVPGLIVHCAAGVSRSTATVLGIGAIRRGPAQALAFLDEAVEHAVQHHVRGIAPVQPNPRLVALLDDALALEGALLEPVLARYWRRRTAVEVFADARR